MNSHQRIVFIFLASITLIVVVFLFVKPKPKVPINKNSFSLPILSSQLLQTTNTTERATLAKERQKTMISLAPLDPAQVLLAAFPDSVRQSFSPEIQPYIEQKVSLQGTLSALVGDNFESKTSQTHYFLVDSQNNRYALYSVSDRKTQINQPTTITGYRIDTTTIVVP